MSQESASQREARQSETSESPRDSASSAETQQFSPAGTRDVSDVVLAEDTTGVAPSFPQPAPAPADKPAKRDKAPMALLPGARVDDFEIVRLLGRGAFGHVYLARQISLDRQVALKISANRGSEGRTMARLEHQHIVQVYSETVDPDFNQRLLCMQLVPGIGLERLISTLHAKRAGSHPEGARQGAGSQNSLPAGYPLGGSPLLASDWNGAEVLAIIDRSASLPAALDTSALHDREALARMDDVEATAWFGTRLAEALDFAHRHGVLHRDIKPANILVNPYGHPLLADFNIASQPVGSEPSGDEMFGGTFAYMSPEHLDAFNPADPTEADAVTPRSDIYSLGVVLQQLLDGRTTVPMPDRKAKMADTLRTMADERRREQPTCRAGAPGARMTLERSIARCVNPSPDERFPSGAELGEQLDGCRRLRQAERQLPPVKKVFQPILRRPFLWLILLVMLPQFVGSAVNITYNATQIVGHLSQRQRELFVELVFNYNAIVYPIALVLFVLGVRPVWRCWGALSRAETVADAEVEAARRRALRLPRFIAGLVALGWFPGGVFPLLIDALAPELGWRAQAHFVVSFWMSGLIALAYSLCGVQFIAVRALYPGLWTDARQFGDTARRELAPVTTQLAWIQVLAGSIPLLAAVLVVLVGDSDDRTFQLLVVALIVLGMAGSHITNIVTRRLSRVVAALTSTK
jgi:serine/threonine protein kinase